MDYTTLTVEQVTAGLEDAARRAQEGFGGLDARQLNWKPDAARWSVAQCLDHLVASNEMMQRAAQDALGGTAPSSIWRRLPLWPGLMGRLLVSSQAPQTTRKFKAPSVAHPASSDIGVDVVRRFVDQQRALIAWVHVLDQQRAMGVIMTSPFVKVITYSVLDGCRLMVAHDHRHLLQARRVLEDPAFT